MATPVSGRLDSKTYTTPRDITLLMAEPTVHDAAGPPVATG